MRKNLLNNTYSVNYFGLEDYPPGSLLLILPSAAFFAWPLLCVQGEKNPASILIFNWRRSELTFFLVGSCWRGGKEIFCLFCIFFLFAYKLLALATPTGILVYLVEIMVVKICIHLPHSYNSPPLYPPRGIL